MHHSKGQGAGGSRSKPARTLGGAVGGLGSAGVKIEREKTDYLTDTF